jgi:hypothetical protein
MGLDGFFFRFIADGFNLLLTLSTLNPPAIRLINQKTLHPRRGLASAKFDGGG